MIGVPIPNPRDSLIANLNHQLDHYFDAGKTVQRSHPALKLRWVGEEVQREDIAQEFKAVLQKRIGANATLALGAFDSK